MVYTKKQLNLISRYKKKGFKLFNGLKNSQYLKCPKTNRTILVKPPTKTRKRK